MEDWQRKREKYRELSDELERAYDRERMCLDRAIGAYRRAAKQDFFSFCSEVIQAFFFNGKWPGAEARMWSAYVKRAERYTKSVEKERDALGFTFPDPNDPASLEACYGPLAEDQFRPGDEIILQSDDGQPQKILIHWVFTDNNGELFYLISKSQPVEAS